jgi:hypothetical protein
LTICIKDLILREADHSDSKDHIGDDADDTTNLIKPDIVAELERDI